MAAHTTHHHTLGHAHAPRTYAELGRGHNVMFGTGSPVRTVRNITHSGPGAPWVPQGCVEIICSDGYGAHVLANLPLRITA